MPDNILAPGATLIAWTLIMLLWMFATRMGGLKRAGVDLSKTPPGGRGQDLEGVLEPKAMWKAHNLNHLMEQPTIFYPVIILLHLSGAATPLAIKLAWGYVGFRIIHSIWQSTINIVPIRLLLFIAGSLCLIALAVLAILGTFTYQA